MDYFNELAEKLCAVNTASGISQDVYVVEECSELIKELMKERRGKGDKTKILDEACDVLTTVAILLHSFGATKEEVEGRMAQKIQRAINRFEDNGEL